MEKALLKLAQEAVKELYHVDVDTKQLQFQKTKKEFEGDLTLVTFPLLRVSKKSPEQTGEELGNYLMKSLSDISGFNVVKGFLNISISDDYWVKQLKSIVAAKDYGKRESTGKTIMVEYSSPNTNKPLHLGHIRNNLLGYSVAEILKANGNDVVKTQIINDRGIHICKSMLAWKLWGNEETPESSGMKGDKLVGKYYVEFDKHFKEEVSQIMSSGVSEEAAVQQSKLMLEAQDMLRKWEAKDPDVMKLWEMMNGWCYQGFDVTYDRLGVDFDKLYYESDTYLEGKKQVITGLEKNIFFKKEDGSVWIDLSNEGLDEKILQRADGTAVYMTQDIGTAILRYDNYPKLNEIVYTVGNEQDYHFKVLFKVLNNLGYDWANNCRHLSYGMVDLPSGKMKSREGTVVDADDLMEEMAVTARNISEELGKLDGLAEDDKAELYDVIGLGALKYFMLKVDPKKRMLFNPEESVDFNGNTGPFVQYTHARICSVLRKYGKQVSSDFNVIVLDRSERELIKLLDEYPVAVKEAGDHYSPAIIANYTYELVKAYNHFYQTVPILKAEGDELMLRIAISKAVKDVVASGMLLLGIQVPERM